MTQSLPRVDEVSSTDVVVIGAGVAGLRVAHGMAPHRVDLLTLGKVGRSGSSPRAQGGIAASLGPDDSATTHADDTIAAADGIADRECVELLTGRAAREIERLQGLGMRFDQLPSGYLDRGREAAHSRHRILHANGDGTGAELVRTLGRAVDESAHIRVFGATQAIELIRREERVVGVVARLPNDRLIFLQARAVVLATGGVGGLYSRTTNPAEARGEGVAMAARVGACLTDLEFVQFHPTALGVWCDPSPLITEALRGRGAKLVTAEGEILMETLHPLGDLAPRDVVARTIWTREQNGDRTYLDAREVFQLQGVDAFPTVAGICSQFGIDPISQPIPVSPAAHYLMGGVWTDARARTSLSGLWACGEVAGSGVHGANRLASNSLLEALVFGGIAVDNIKQATVEHSTSTCVSEDLVWGPEPQELEAETVRGLVLQLRKRMWQDVGLVRHATGLGKTRQWLEARLAQIGPHGALGSALLVSYLIASSALEREESRGSHFRSDFPRRRSDRAQRSKFRLRKICPGAEMLELAFESDRPELEPVQGGRR